MSRRSGDGGPNEGILGFVAAAERTALAWERTGFGLVVIGALIVHAHREPGVPFAPLALGLAVLAAGATISVVVAPRRYRRITADVRSDRTPVVRRAAPLTALAVVLVAVLAAALLQP